MNGSQMKWSFFSPNISLLPGLRLVRKKNLILLKIEQRSALLLNVENA
jgi:hypothetical protein